MKSLIPILLLLFLSTTKAFAAEGVVMVLEAPLLNKPNLNKATVVDLVRKGKTIYIHNTDVSMPPSSINYDPKLAERLAKIPPRPKKGFYQTIDSAGNRAYIQQKYVKLIYKDDREKRHPVASFSPDPTDYRLPEPISEDHPFIKPDKRRAYLAFLTRPTPKNRYDFKGPILNEDFSNQKALAGTYTSNIDFDKSNRLYFGGAFEIGSQDIRINFADGRMSDESRGHISVGPFISYDSFRNDDYLFTVAGRLSLTYTRSIQEVSSHQGFGEERIFTGFSFDPAISGYLQKRDFIVKHLNLIGGAELQAILPHSLKTSTSPTFPQLWNSEADSIDFPLGFQAALFVGIQSNY